MFGSEGKKLFEEFARAKESLLGQSTTGEGEALMNELTRLID